MTQNNPDTGDKISNTAAPTETIYSSYFVLEHRVRDLLAVKDVDAALNAVKDYVTAVMNTNAAPGGVNGSKKLDDLCRSIGEIYRSDDHKSELLRDFEAVTDNIVVVCTGMYRYGGTTLFVSDILEAHKGKNCFVLTTNLLEDMKPEDLDARSLENPNHVLRHAPAGTALSKLDWVFAQLVSLKPSRVFLLNHHQDSVIVSAASIFSSYCSIYFLHHADYNLCLGVHLDNILHVDIHNVGFCNCRDQEKIANNVYLPLVVRDKAQSQVEREFLKSDLVTCSSGTAHKFLNFYLYPYSDLVVKRLMNRSGVHIHIGSLPEPDVQNIRTQLQQNSIASERFVHVPWVKDLWGALIEFNVDLFIGSFPIGGARTTFEVIGAGIPMLLHQSYLSRFYSSRDLSYPNHFVWKYPKDFVDIIRNVDAEALLQHSRRARGHYLLNYSFESIDLEQQIARISSGAKSMSAPPLYEHEPDLLDRTLHYAHLDYLAKCDVERRISSKIPSEPETKPNNKKSTSFLSRIFSK